ncbi:uncharacterized protein G2W53_009384 [Senna tora]|uniref:Uncharacterized protein n=1 Tax=Senna tora TaxID=362788 RepID=A0A835C9V6_9FABA|nr:uncharacterized protein G2W53_009384 [Senna tora]
MAVGSQSTTSKTQSGEKCKGGSERRRLKYE